MEFVRANRPDWVAWSGGKDSTVVCDLVQRVWPGTPFVHFDAGFDFPETYALMERCAAERGWRYEPVSTGDALSVMVARRTWEHGTEADDDAPAEGAFWDAITAGPAVQAVEQFGTRMAWGLRADEASRRLWYMRGHGTVFLRSDGVTILSPVAWWTTEDIWAYHAHHSLPVNGIYAKLEALGAPEKARRTCVVLAANGLERGRAVWLRRGWPDLWQQLAEVLPRLREFS